jgi:hypothetical protein
MNVTTIRTLPFYKGVSKDLTSPLNSTKLTYAEGTVVEANGIDLDPGRGCGKGINFCRSIAEALQWGPVVVEITVPSGVKVVDTGGKLRAERVRVGQVVDLAGAYLARAHLTGAHLTGANLANAHLTDADLADAYLAGANLTGANLTRANLADAYLADAYLARANLADANLTGANLTGARGNARTVLPAGWKVEKSGLIVRAS